MRGTYRTSERVVKCKNLTLTVISRTPVLSDREREKTKRQIEARLYAVFAGYSTP